MEDMKRNELVAELRSLVSNTEGEFTPEAADKALELRNALETFEATTVNTEDVEAAAADSTDQIEETRAASPTVQIKTNMNTPKFSLGKAVKEAVSGNITGLEAEVIQESRNMASSNGINTVGSVVLDPEAIAAVTRAGDFQADSTDAGDKAGDLVGVDVATPIYNLRPRSIFDNLGVTRLTGLRGDLQLPIGAASTAATADEVASANQSTGAITSVSLTPQRIAAMLTASGQLMKQSEANVEAFLMGDLMRAVGQAQDSYFFGKLYGALTAVDGTDVSMADVLAEMEADLDTEGADRDSAEILVHPDAFKAFRTAPMISGVNAIADAKSVIGYNTRISSLAADDTDVKLAVMGDYSDFVIGEWGGLDLTVDPYSQAHTNQVRLIVNTHVDAALRQVGNYSCYKNVGVTS